MNNYDSQTAKIRQLDDTQCKGGEQDLGYSYAVVGGFIGVVMLEDNLEICTKVLNAH